MPQREDAKPGKRTPPSYPVLFLQFGLIALTGVTLRFVKKREGALLEVEAVATSAPILQ